ncbi:hypothetical protein LS67_004660 [Helicobacter sp. MIT 03-1616]|nr:hypothetical protein LS67_004660 [Helicobacter sp. MIT 03-1616]
MCFYYFGIYYLFAGAISFVIATLWNFLFAKKIIFHHSPHSLLKESSLIYLLVLGA